MSGGRVGSLIVAASIGAVEALKDQLGVCRWNYAFRLMQQRAESSVNFYYQTRLIPAAGRYSSSSMVSVSGEKMIGDAERMKKKRTEKSLMKVMDISCWGPSTIRF